LIDKEFLLHKGWALKGSQKLGNRRGNRIKKNIKAMLECFFLRGNRKNKKKISAQAMHDELSKYVEIGEIEKDDVPKITTIQNWISSYTRAFKQKAEI
ncbi:15737_t:CDS:1, partial [Cetraspora pellucida]